MQNKQNICKGGFSLLELLVVVVIISILVAVAVANYDKAARRAELVEVKSIINAIQKNVVLFESSGQEGITYTTPEKAGEIDIGCKKFPEDDPIACELSDGTHIHGASNTDYQGTQSVIAIYADYGSEREMVLRRDPNVPSPWFWEALTGRNQKEVCEDAKELGFPALPPLVDVCAEEGVALEAVELP